MQKILGFMKKNVYYLLLGFCILAIATIIIVAVAVNNKKPADPTGGGGNQIVNPPGPGDGGGDPILPVEIVFEVPVRTGTIGMDYSDSVSVYNETMRREEMHLGIDFLADLGTNVYAVYDGTVLNTTYDVLFGAVIWIDHGEGLVSVYKSLDENLNVKKGDRLRSGDVIGKIGASLFEVLEGPHLHFEVHQDGAIINPYDKLLAGDK